VGESVNDMTSEEKPLFTTREEALQAPGEIYEHFKGGIYRLVQRGVRDSESHEERGVIYEHLWPHQHDFWFRLEKSFFENLDNGEPRFKLIKKD